MLQLFIDQDFDHDILRGLVRRLPRLNYVTAFEAGLSEVKDPDILIWTAENRKVLLTHDRKTMPVHFASLLNIRNGISRNLYCAETTGDWSGD